MNKISTFACSLAFVCLAGSAWAGGFMDVPGVTSSPGSTGMSDGMGMGSVATPLTGSDGMGGNFTMPFNPSSLANTYSGAVGMGMSNTGMPGGMPMIDLRQVIAQGIRSLPQQQRYSGASSMANQNLSQLNQNIANGMSPVYQMRNNIRDQIMMNRVADISRMGQSTFRPLIMPGAVQSMISQIRPWEFPNRFQSAMMPAMIPMVSAPIKQQQMAFMQQGIMNNPNFPNVPLPAPAFGPSGYNSGYPSPGGMMGMGYGMPGMMGGAMPGGYGMPGMMMGGMGYGYGMMPGGMSMGGAYGYPSYGY